MQSLISKIVRLIIRLYQPEALIDSNVQIDPRAFIARGGPVKIAGGSCIRAGAMLLPSGGCITIGSRTSINQYVVINAEGGVCIGDDVMIAAFVSVFAANHKYQKRGQTIRSQGMFTKGGVVIGNDVWIGTHAVILDGVEIAEGSIVAAGAVVTKSTEPYSINAGTPAKKIGQRD